MDNVGSSSSSSRTCINLKFDCFLHRTRVCVQLLTSFDRGGSSEPAAELSGLTDRTVAADSFVFGPIF